MLNSLPGTSSFRTVGQSGLWTRGTHLFPLGFLYGRAEGILAGSPTNAFSKWNSCEKRKGNPFEKYRFAPARLRRTWTSTPRKPFVGKGA